MSNSARQPLVPCDICGASDCQELYSAPDRLNTSGELFSIARCSGCNVLRTIPFISDEDLGAYYPRDYWGNESAVSDEWIRKSQSEKTRFIETLGLERGRILDVGCGSGFFLRALGDAWERWGVETGEEAVSAARQALGQEHVFQGSLLGTSFPEAKFEVVTFWSALEHMNDPKENLVEARRILQKDGTLVVQVPNAGSYQAQMFKGDWFSLDAPRHRYHFTIKTLRGLLSETRFEPYSVTFASEAHNVHSLRQSLKTRLRAKESTGGYVAFCLAIPFLKPFDFVMSSGGRGATITLAARAV